MGPEQCDQYVAGKLSFHSLLLRNIRQFNPEEVEILRHCFTVNDRMFLSNKGIKNMFICMYLNDVVGLFFGRICSSSHW